jgi:hypothetical protein
VLDQGEECPAGTLMTTDLEDCRVVCSYNPANGITGTNLYWLAGIIQYDFQQLEPSGAEYILERLKVLNCQIKLPEVELKDEDGTTLLDENGKLCLENARLVAYNHGEYYLLGEKLGFFGYSVAPENIIKKRMGKDKK